MALACPEDLKPIWEDWVEYRRQKETDATTARDRADWRYTEIGGRKVITQLAKLGAARARAAVDHSIAKGWRGIFEPDDRGSQRNSKYSGGGHMNASECKTVRAMAQRLWPAFARWLGEQAETTQKAQVESWDKLLARASLNYADDALEVWREQGLPEELRFNRWRRVWPVVAI